MLAYEINETGRTHGILATETGFGKTLSILALTLVNPTARQVISLRDFGCMLQEEKFGFEWGVFRLIYKFAFGDHRQTNREEGDLQILSTPKNICVDSENWTYLEHSLIVVPYGLMGQWIEEIQSKTKCAEVVVISRECQVVKALNRARNPKSAAIFLCSSTMYGVMQEKSNSQKLVWQRMIVDEADTIELRTGRKTAVAARFYWFVTATFENLAKISANGFIKNTFSRLRLSELESLCVGNNIDEDMKTEALRGIQDYELYRVPCASSFISDMCHFVLGSDHEITAKIDAKIGSNWEYPVAYEILRASSSRKTIWSDVRVNVTNLKNLQEFFESHPGDLPCLSCGEQFGELVCVIECWCKLPRCPSCTDQYLTCPFCQGTPAMVCREWPREFMSVSKWRAGWRRTFEKCCVQQFFDSIVFCAEENRDTRKREGLALLKSVGVYLDSPGVCEDVKAQSNGYVAEHITRYFQDPSSIADIAYLSEKRKADEADAERKAELANHVSETTKFVVKTCPFLPDSDNMDKASICLRILQHERKKQTILFINNPRSLNAFVELLPADGSMTKAKESQRAKAAFTWRVLRGSSESITVAIKQFKEGKTNVLVVNGLTHGSGLNLQEADCIIIWNRVNHHVFAQMVGRRQRLGCDADSCLKVYEMVAR